jgi:hypothetical protein
VIKFYSKVKKLEQKKELLRSWKTGKKTEDGKDEIADETRDMGWFMLLEGSWESLYVGKTKPDNLEIGDSVEVIIRRV